MKCLSCGSDNPDDRFFCGVCGATLRDTEVNKTSDETVANLPRDIDGRALTTSIMGAALAMFGLVLYGIGLTRDLWSGIDAWSDFPGLFWICGFSLISLGVLINVSPQMPILTRSAAGLLVVSAVIGLFICLTVAYTPTRIEILGPPGYERIVEHFDDAPTMGVLMLPMCLLPLLGAWELLITWKWAIPTSIGYAAVGVTTALWILPEFVEAFAVASVSVPLLGSIVVLGASLAGRNPSRFGQNGEKHPSR